jgi:hypothetical protein
MGLDNFRDLDNEVINNDFIISDFDLLLWPLIRTNVYEFIKTRNNEQTPHAKHPRFSMRNFKFLFYMLLYAHHKKHKFFKIIFYTTARGRTSNKNFNYYSDYFSSLLDKSLVIDKASRGNYFIPDKTDHFSTGDYGLVRALVPSKIKIYLIKQQNPDIKRFIDFLKNKELFKNEILEKIRKKIYEYYFSYSSYHSYQLKVLKKLNPEIIFVNCGSYGQYNAMLIKTAKDQGIVTGEFQHGTISKGHLAYNYGEGVLKSDKYRKYFPDYVLTFGDYWNEQMNIPGKSVTIGAPHFYHSIEKYKTVEEKEKTILVVSQGTITQTFVDIAKYLAKTLPQYTIIFKLHPGEVPFKNRYEELYKYKNIHIAKSGDIYKFIAESENIVACYSTTVFEAMGFNKKIFILDNEMSRTYIPKDVGVRFKTNIDLKELIKNNEKQETTYDLAYYFNPDWKKNYKRFLEEKVDTTL